MAYIGTQTITNAENELAAMAHGTTINQIQNIYGVFNRAARRVLTDVDPWETKVVLEIGAVFDQVFDYPCPTDLKGNKIIDIYPQVARTPLDNFGQSYNKSFDLNKSTTLSSSFTILTNSGQRDLRINAKDQQTGIVVNLIESITGNGTFAVGGNAANLLNDNLYFVDDTASSISFNLNSTGIVGSTGYVENSTMSAVDLTTHLNQAKEFFWVYMPAAASITSIELRWGSSATAYWAGSVTAQQNGDAFVNGWNLLAVPWVTATKTGTPTVSAINYMRITLTYDGTLQTAIRVNDYQSRLGQILMMEYYSKYLFRSSVNVMQETVLADTDLIQLDTDAYDLWLMAVASETVQQMQGLDALFYDDNHFESRYQNSLAAYRSKYKSELTKPQETYYRLPRPSPRRFFGSRWFIN